jgi:transcriptional regulator with XRE-family HTH domain
MLYHIGYRMSPERIGMRVKAYRERRKLTQEALAERAGISRTYLARLETGKHDPTASVLEKLAKALGVKVGRLLE